MLPFAWKPSCLQTTHVSKYISRGKLHIQFPILSRVMFTDTIVWVMSNIVSVWCNFQPLDMVFILLRTQSVQCKIDLWIRFVLVICSYFSEVWRCLLRFLTGALSFIGRGVGRWLMKLGLVNLSQPTSTTQPQCKVKVLRESERKYVLSYFHWVHLIKKIMDLSCLEDEISVKWSHYKREAWPMYQWQEGGN